ncbi:hairy-related 11 [Cololabis saira]|uniref:hairy-related 11 n=1 Tax=Cololabis saira TaxID=129043 RepID=UPI002AD1FC69|nr:hairy-related 11 [Cololabis saira]
MTRKPQSPTLDDGKTRKRILKPVVEKKRRDRINKSLAELRSLLLNSTSDPRLQSPKIEKAEILDLAVEYIKQWTDMKTLSNGLKLGLAESSAPPLLSSESAGFQQCVAQLTSYIHKLTPAQRTNLIERLTHHTESWQSRPDFNRNVSEMSDSQPPEGICTSECREDSPWLLFPSHSPFQPLSCSTPRHDYVTPPSSPWFSPSFSTYATSPSFPSFACHFSFPPSLSPPSSNTSFLSLSPTHPHTSPLGLHVSPPTSRRHSDLADREEVATNSSSARWRPWI